MKKKFNSIFELFKNFLKKNEKVDILNIDAKLIDFQKESFENAFKIKEFILNCSVASKVQKKQLILRNLTIYLEEHGLKKIV